MSEKLVETKLRLSEAERDAVLALKGDRGLNVCLRRAVQQWIVREQALAEAAILALNADGAPPLRVVPGDVAHLSQYMQPQNGTATSAAPTKVDVTTTPEPKEPVVAQDSEEGQPTRRRPPTAAEHWGQPRGPSSA